VTRTSPGHPVVRKRLKAALRLAYTMIDTDAPPTSNTKFVDPSERT